MWGIMPLLPNTQRSISISIQEYTIDIFKYLDGERTIKNIIKKVRSNSKTSASNSDIFSEIKKIYAQFNLHDAMLIKNKQQKYCTYQQLQNNVALFYKTQ